MGEVDSPKSKEPKAVYIKPVCEVVEVETINMFAMSAEGGGDTEGDHEFGERGFTNERNRGEWGDLWKE